MAAKLGYDIPGNLYQLNIPLIYIKKLERMIILEKIVETLRTMKEKYGTKECIRIQAPRINTFSEDYCLIEYEIIKEELKKATDDFKHYCYNSSGVDCWGLRRGTILKEGQEPNNYESYSVYNGVHGFRQTIQRKEILKGCSETNIPFKNIRVKIIDVEDRFDIPFDKKEDDDEILNIYQREMENQGKRIFMKYFINRIYTIFLNYSGNLSEIEKFPLRIEINIELLKPWIKVKRPAFYSFIPLTLLWDSVIPFPSCISCIPIPP